jgi:hypothetical protein
MISNRIIHIGLGSTGEGIIRGMLGPDGFRSRIKWLNEDAHVPLSVARALSDAPAFTFVRNPYDWYISSYIVELRKHRWRGTFREWFFNRHPIPLRMAERWDYFGGAECDYVGRFENFLPALIYIFNAIIPDIITSSEVSTMWPRHVALQHGMKWIEGFEQWLREDLISPEIKAVIDDTDGEILETYRYDWNTRYYFPGGDVVSFHEGVTEFKWEQEKKLSAFWEEWGQEQPSVFLKASRS